jgi:hypothetical protein
VARPEGLTLERVDYPAENEMAARAIATRNMRELDN